MPKGSPNAQTKASEKYQKKAGYMVKGFKLKRELVEEFEKACERDGISNAGKISELMREYIQSQKTESELIEKNSKNE